MLGNIEVLLKQFGYNNVQSERGTITFRLIFLLGVF
jgi:hypothetical protein